LPAPATNTSIPTNTDISRVFTFPSSPKLLFDPEFAPSLAAKYF
jgi:hypothetical protein